MTLRELKSEVENILDIDVDISKRFVRAAEISLENIHARFPKIKTAEFPLFPTMTVFRQDYVRASDGEVTLKIPKGTLKMKLSGEGKYTTVIGGERAERCFSCQSSSVVLEFSSEGEIIFAPGEFYAWDIEVTSDPHHPFAEGVKTTSSGTVVDLSRFLPDLLYLTELPKNARGKDIFGLKSIGDTLISLPKSFSGIISVTYRAKPNKITEEEAIDISPAFQPLLTVLTAYHCLLPYEPVEAEEYLSMYEELSELIDKGRKISATANYYDTTRWA